MGRWRAQSDLHSRTFRVGREKRRAGPAIAARLCGPRLRSRRWLALRPIHWPGNERNSFEQIAGRNAQYLLQRGDTRGRFAQGILVHGHHFDLRGRLEFDIGALLQNKFAQFIGYRQQLEDADAAAITGAAAFLASGAPIKRAFDISTAQRPNLLPQRRRHRTFGAAALANAPEQALGQDAFERRRDEEGLHAHVDQSGDRAGRVVGVKRAENLVAGKGRANGNLRRFGITDFADHHNVGILPQNRAQAGGKGKVTGGADGDLRHARQLVFHRVFDGEDFQFRRVDAPKNGIKRSGFSAARGTGGEKKSVRLFHEAGEQGGTFRVKAKFPRREGGGILFQQAHHQAFAINR